VKLKKLPKLKLITKSCKVFVVLYKHDLMREICFIFIRMNKDILIRSLNLPDEDKGSDDLLKITFNLSFNWSFTSLATQISLKMVVPWSSK